MYREGKRHDPTQGVKSLRELSNRPVPARDGGMEARTAEPYCPRLESRICKI